MSFLKEVLGKKDTSLYKKIDKEAQNRQANLYKLSPKGTSKAKKEQVKQKGTSLVRKGTRKAKKEQDEIGNRTKVGNNKDIIRI